MHIIFYTFRLLSGTDIYMMVIMKTYLKRLMPAAVIPEDYYDRHVDFYNHKSSISPNKDMYVHK